MLESGVDRIITQVVDPKLNHTFRPHIENAIHEFLAGETKDEAVGNPGPEAEQQDAVGAVPHTPWLWGAGVTPKGVIQGYGLELWCFVSVVDWRVRPQLITEADYRMHSGAKEWARKVLKASLVVPNLHLR